MREGYILAQSRYENQYEVRFYTDKYKNGKKVYKPKDIVEYKIAGEDLLYNPLFKATDCFMLLVKDGAIATYIYYNTGDGEDETRQPTCTFGQTFIYDDLFYIWRKPLDITDFSILADEYDTGCNLINTISITKSFGT